MNQLNYASLEASKRLYNAGIVLETEAEYAFDMFLGRYDLKRVCSIKVKMSLPAPTMAEVWRELPACHLDKWIDGTLHCYLTEGPFHTITNTNSTDALIDLLIWERKEE